MTTNDGSSTAPAVSLMHGTTPAGAAWLRCCLCFEAFTDPDALCIPPGGTARQDVCWDCCKHETTALLRAYA